jgi:type II secretory ATPase GspE/PulE/Tfp pilus assembly ATPase PilB-like protein
MGAYELLEMTPRVVAAFNGGETQAYLDAARREIGELSLAQHVCDLVQAGRTTVQEAMRLIGHASEPDPRQPAAPQ